VRPAFDLTHRLHRSQRGHTSTACTVAPGVAD
jgi:hypothetical protein